MRDRPSKNQQARVRRGARCGAAAARRTCQRSSGRHHHRLSTRHRHRLPRQSRIDERVVAAARTAVAETARRDRLVRHHRDQRHRQRRFRRVRPQHRVVARRSRSLSRAAVDRPPPFGYRSGEAGQDAWPHARLPEHRHDRSRHLAPRRVLRLGIRIIQLTYNDRNFVGDGCLERRTPASASSDARSSRA